VKSGVGVVGKEGEEGVGRREEKRGGERKVKEEREGGDSSYQQCT